MKDKASADKFMKKEKENTNLSSMFSNVYVQNTVLYMMQVYPLVLYLSSARLWNENRTGEIEKIPGRTDAYQRCLDPKRGNQSSFEYIKLLGNLATEENDGMPLPAYEVIMDAVKYSLQEELLPEQQVIYSSRYGEIAIKNPDGTRNEARNYALECREGWRCVKGTREEERYLRLIEMLAQSSGFFSVWINIFKDDAEVKKTLITVFKGTNEEWCKD